MAKKPANLIYGVDEKPGWGPSLLLGFQHICLCSIAFIFPVIIVDAIGGTSQEACNLISMAMLATGFATILQGINRGPVGSGYLCPSVNGFAFLSASLMAGKVGGLSLIFGMTAAAGCFEALFSRFVSRMRAVFPAEVTGTIVMMVGIEIIPMATMKFLGIDKTHPSPQAASVFVAVITLTAMAGFNVWGKGKMRLYSVLMGLMAGYIAAILTGILTMNDIRQLIAAPFFALPSIGPYGLSFNLSLLIPFVVAVLSSALKTMGDLTTCQKINDAEWKRPDMHTISRGVLACACGNVLSGLMGALGQSVSSSNIGLSIATGATSRRIAYAIGGLLIGIAFFPMLASVFVIMPTPIVGASLIFAISFMILAGIQILMSRMIDSRKTFVVGISVIFGLSVDFMPDLYKNIHPWIQPLFSFSLSLSTVCAIFLNLFFRIGIAKSATLELTPGVDSSAQIFRFMEKQGALWGALRDVIYRAALVMNEFLESAAKLNLAKDRLSTVVRFDEFNLDVDISYQGTPMTFPDKRPSEAELLADESGIARLSGFLMKAHADRVKSDMKNGRCHVQFHFVH